MEDSPNARATSPAIAELARVIRDIQNRLRLFDEPSQFRQMLEDGVAPGDKLSERK
jgi:hypothetical protein